MRTIRFIHKWTGLVIGLFFLFLCLSGLLIVAGKLAGSYAPIFKWAKQFHTTLLMGETGEKIVAIATLLAIQEIITGYILWAKRTVALSRSTRNPWSAIRKNVGFTFPNPLLGLHNAGGFWCGIPVMIMILTSLTWCFGWYSDAIYALFDSPNLFHTLHALHTGSWQGNYSRILWLAATALATTLPLTGLLLTLRHRNKTKK